MHALTLLAAMPALAIAQLLTPGQLAAIPAPILQTAPIGQGSSINPVSKRSNLVAKRTSSDCQPQARGCGPIPHPDTPSAFLANSAFSSAALNAQVPAGWNQVFSNLQASTSAASYLGYKSYTSYDPAQCASDCSSISGCASFNIFFERDPGLNPAPSCPNPPSTTVIKCSFWGVPITSSTATNQGQWRNGFQVVFAGSNGYTRPHNCSASGYTATYTNNATINAPGVPCNTYITMTTHVNKPYDPALCAADCSAQALETNPLQGLRCHFVTSYELLKNGVVQAQVCALYSRSWGAQYAVNTGYTCGSNVYTIADAFSLTLTSDPGSNSCPSSSSTTVSTTKSTTVSTTKSTTKCTTKSTTMATSHVTTTTASTAVATTSAAPSSYTACPQPVSYLIAGPERTLYAVCLGTDFGIPSPAIYSNVVDNRACSVLCDNYPGCSQASYYLDSQTCFLKGNASVAASNWVSSPAGQTLQRVPDGTPLTSCPVPYTIQQGGITWTVCPATNIFNNPAANIWYGVTSEYACAALCQQTSDCQKFVYSWPTQTCYDKGNPQLQNAIWTVQAGNGVYYQS